MTAGASINPGAGASAERRLSPVRRMIPWMAGAALLGVAFPLFLVLRAHAVNGVHCFPLDDPWIHLTYARTLHDHHAFAYWPGDASTQGSTSPLYTFLLALGFSVTRDEKILSYTLGILFQALFLVTFWAWARRRLRSLVWAAVAVVLLAFDQNVGTLAASGMETTLFLFLIALAFWAHATGRRRLLGAALGLSIWARPDGLILLLAFILDWACDLRFPAAAREPQGARAAAGPGDPGAAGENLPTAAWRSARLGPLLPAALLILAYAIFNLAVGGALLPNTFAAKTEYYRHNSRLIFVQQDLREVFAHHGWLILLPFWVGGCAAEAWRWLRKVPGGLRPEAAWALGLPLAYFLLLPFGHRFDRYLVPALPAAAVLGLSSMKELATRLSGHGARSARRAGARAETGSFGWRSPAGLGAALLLAAAGGLTLATIPATANLYTIYCKYHWERHERTGRWLAEHTPADAVIAAHDVGAIAFYSHRKVVDIVGVVFPEAVKHLGRSDYFTYLNALFQREKVTHLAVLRNWCEVDNVEPLFVADPQPELLEVYPWIPGRTHLSPQAAGKYNALAYAELQAGRPEQGIALLQNSLSIDRENSRTWLVLAAACQIDGRTADAEEAYRQALSLFPDFPEARLQFAAFLKSRGRPQEARAILQALLQTHPDYPRAAELYRSLGG